MQQNELNKQVAIVMLKIIAFFFVYIVLLAYGGLFVYAAYYVFSNFFKDSIIESFEQSEILRLVFLSVICIIPCGFLLLYGLYPLKFIFRKGSKRNKDKKETTEEECPALFEFVRNIASATGNKMPKHIYLSREVNAAVFYDNTLKSILFPTRKNLIVGLGLFVNTNTEEVKAILSHEFGHFAQSSMKIGSVIYYLNSVTYDMAFQEDKWDAALDKYFRGLIHACSIAGFYGIIGYIVLLVLYKILFFTKDVLRWMYKFVNRSYYSLSRQMEFDADHVSCSIVGRDIFESAMIKVEFAAGCEQNADVAWRHLLSSGKYASYFDVFTQYEAVRSRELGIDIRFDKLENNLEDIEEFHSDISFNNVFSDHPSTKERIEAVQDIPNKEHKSLVPAWQLITSSVKQEWEDRILSDNTNEDGYKKVKLFETIPTKELSEWIQKDYEGQVLPKKYRLFFQNLFVFDIDKVDEELGKENPFTGKNREIFREYYKTLSDGNTMSQLISQDEIKYASYKGKVYTVDDLPLKEIEDKSKELYEQCVAIQEDVYAFLLANSDKQIKSLYLYAFEGISVEQALNSLDNDYDKMRNRLANPMNDDDQPDDFWDLKYDFGTLLNKKLAPIVLSCENNIFPMCVSIGANEEYIDKILKYAKSPKPDFTKYNIQQVIEYINNSLEYRGDVIGLINGMINVIKSSLADIAREIDNGKSTKELKS